MAKRIEDPKRSKEIDSLVELRGKKAGGRGNKGWRTSHRWNHTPTELHRIPLQFKDSILKLVKFIDSNPHIIDELLEVAESLHANAPQYEPPVVYVKKSDRQKHSEPIEPITNSDDDGTT